MNSRKAIVPQDPDKQGIFLVLVSRAPAPVWEAVHFGKGGIEVEKKNRPCLM